MENASEWIAEMREWIAVFASVVTGGSALFGVLMFNAKMARLEEQRQRNDWLNQMRMIYAQFWGNPVFDDIRRRIELDDYYPTLKSALEKNMERSKGNLSTEEIQIIDGFDRLCSVMSQVHLLGAAKLNEEQKEFWKEVFGSYWMEKMLERAEINLYLTRYWPRLLSAHNENVINSKKLSHRLLKWPATNYRN